MNIVQPTNGHEAVVVLDLGLASHALTYNVLDALRYKSNTGFELHAKETIAYVIGSLVSNFISYLQSGKSMSPETYNSVLLELAQSLLDIFPNEEQAMNVVKQTESNLLGCFINSAPHIDRLNIVDYYFQNDLSVILRIVV